jgi:hypothetical protein
VSCFVIIKLMLTYKFRRVLGEPRFESKRYDLPSLNLMVKLCTTLNDPDSAICAYKAAIKHWSVPDNYEPDTLKEIMIDASSYFLEHGLVK